MNQEVLQKSALIQRIIFLVYCLFFGVILIVFSILGYEASRISLGILFLLASVFHISEFHHNFKNKIAASIYGGLAVAGIIIGIGTLLDNFLELWVVCLAFGIMDVVSGVLEIITNAAILKRTIKSRLNITEYLISVADIIFGILFIIHLEHGLLVHVIYLAVVFFANAAITLAELVLEGEHNE